MNGISLILSGLVTIVAAIVLLMTSETDLGFYIVPMAACGWLCGGYVVEWMRGRLSSFDPLFIFGLFGYMYFFVIPILQITWDFWMYIPSLTQETLYFYMWPIINFVGLSWIVVCTSQAGKARPDPEKGIVGIDKKRFAMLVLGAMLISFSAYIFVIMRAGGLQGYINSYNLRLEMGRSEYDIQKGIGIIVLIADSFPNLFSMAMIVYFRDKPIAQKKWFLLALVACCLPVYLFVGAGFQGSRSAIIITTLWLIGMYHLAIRPLSRKMLLIMCLGGFVFMNTWFFYKFGGLEALFDPSRWSSIQDARGPSNKYVLTRDLGRFDMQVLILKKYNEPESPPYSLGRSYAVAPFALVPSFIMKQPPPITKEKSELIYGPGSYAENYATSILVGQFGEMFINFGWAGIVIYYALFGFFLRWLDRTRHSLAKADPRLLLMPILFLLPVQFLISDSNVIVMFLFRYLMLPSVVIWLSLQKSPPKASVAV